MCDGRGVQMGHQLMVISVTDPSLQWRGMRVIVLQLYRHTPLILNLPYQLHFKKRYSLFLSYLLTNKAL